MPKFTPTEQRIIDALSDGMPKTRGELWAALDTDEHTHRKVLDVYMSRIRKKLLEVGQDIVCRYRFADRPVFQHVRLLNSSE